MLKYVHSDDRADFHFRRMLPVGQETKMTDMSVVLLDFDKTVALVAGARLLNVKQLAPLWDLQ